MKIDGKHLGPLPRAAARIIAAAAVRKAKEKQQRTTVSHPRQTTAARS